MLDHLDQVFDGFLIPVTWDYRNNIKKACLYTESGENYFVEYQDGIDQLKHLMNQRVQVIGTISMNEKKRPYITINQITSLSKKIAC